ncbi:MAG: hypothetical protein ABUT39_21375 [Acidobacteriota bacterium]
MSPYQTRIATAVLLMAGIGLSALLGQISDQLGQVLRVRKTVKIEDASGIRRSLRQKDAIGLDQTIQAYPDSAVELSFDGDGRLMLWPSTKIKLKPPGPKSERHSDCDREVVARIELLRGDLQVDHDSDRDVAALKPRILEIETRDARICLFGTSIQVHVDLNPDVGTGVFVRQTGARVRSLAGDGGWVRLEQSQQTFARREGKLRVVTVKRFTLPDQRAEGRFNDSPLFDKIVF